MGVLTIEPPAPEKEDSGVWRTLSKRVLAIVSPFSYLITRACVSRGWRDLIAEKYDWLISAHLRPDGQDARRRRIGQFKLTTVPLLVGSEAGHYTGSRCRLSW